MRCLVPAARAPLSSTRRCGLLGQNGKRDFVRFVVVGRARMCVIIRTRTSLICNTLFAQFLDGQRESEYEYNTTHGDRKAGDIVLPSRGGGTYVQFASERGSHGGGLWPTCTVIMVRTNLFAVCVR